MNIAELAGRAKSFLETHSRPPERQGADPTSFVTLKDRHPAWVEDLVHKAHADMMPEDFKYETIYDVLERLEEGHDPEEMDLEADIYTHDLLRWLASNLERAGYVDEAVLEMGHSSEGSGHGGGIIGDIAMGQWYEKNEIWNLVVEALEERLREIDLGEPEVFKKHGKKPGPKDWDPRQQ